MKVQDGEPRDKKKLMLGETTTIRKETIKMKEVGDNQSNQDGDDQPNATYIVDLLIILRF
jgi:hypothetical protein